MKIHPVEFLDFVRLSSRKEYHADEFKNEAFGK
jgi:hypothetical protein